MPDFGKYHSSGLRCSGDLANLYNAIYADGSGYDHVLIKVAKSKDDNDLLWNEAGVLGFLYPPGYEEASYFRYLPRLIDSFETTEGLRANVIVRAKDYVSLEDVLRAFPKGLDFRDVVWMYKRLLVGLGYAHSQGVVHGAVLPPHVLVHPTGHGAKIIDWSYALNFSAFIPRVDMTKPVPPAPKKERNAWTMLLEDSEYDPDPVVPKGPPPDPNRKYIRAVSVAHEHFYAPEIWAKKTPTPATDIYMAAKVAVALLGGNVETNQVPDTVPIQIKAFLQASLLPATKQRPQDAWDLETDLTKLLEGLVGKPKYRPLAMPKAS